MLVELSVQDFALIEGLALSFSPKLNVITGETGAGKSILIGALGTLMGMRTGPDMIRTGAEKSSVEARFILPSKHPALRMIQDLGGEAERGEVILRRELSSDGRTRVWVGGVSVPVKTLKDIGDRLVDFHGQHEHQLLLATSEHVSILDAFAGNADLIEQVQGHWEKLRSLREERANLIEQQKRLAAQRDMMEFERKELEDINPQPGEFDAIEAERKVLENVEQLGSLLSALTHLLSEAEESIVARLGQGRRWLHEAAEIDADLGQEAASEYEQLEILAQDLSTRLAERLGSLEADPLRLEQIQARLESLRRLIRRYGSIEGALGRRNELLSMIDIEAGSAERIAELEAEIVAEHGRFTQAVTGLSQSRRKGAATLSAQVTKLLASLGMERAQFTVELTRAPAETVNPVESDAIRLGDEVCEAGPNGAEQVEFMISPNLGEPLRPLARIASGGEVSRTMLAIKSILAEHDPVVTMVFDEIDLGVSGRIADSVGARMRELARHRQIIAITHLPQIAACADRHVIVSKREARGHTVTEARVLTDDERPRAIAELLSGAEVTLTALEHARAMLRELSKVGEGR